MPNPNDPAAPAPAAPAAATPPQAPAPAPAQPSLLNGQVEGEAATGDDWLPEKYRVNGEDGALDEAASARKLADAYKALESKLGKAAALPPATPEEYKLEAPEGIPAEAFEQFTGDELFKNFVKDAHAQGMTNEQLQFVTSKYLALAPELLAADKSLTAEEAKAELAKVWPDDGAMQKNLASVVKAINGFGAEADDVPGSRSRLMEKYGTDPDFIAFAASVAKDMSEDRTPTGGTPSADLDIEALQATEAYWKPEHPDHARTKAKVDEHYARKYGTRARAGGIVSAGR